MKQDGADLLPMWDELLRELGVAYDGTRKLLVRDPGGIVALPRIATGILRELCAARGDVVAYVLLAKSAGVGAQARTDRRGTDRDHNAMKRIDEERSKRIARLLNQSPYEVLNDPERQGYLLRRRPYRVALPGAATPSSPSPSWPPIASRPHHDRAPNLSEVASVLSDGSPVVFVLGTGLSRSTRTREHPRVVDAIGIAECAAALARRNPQSRPRTLPDFSWPVELPLLRGGHLVVCGSSEVNSLTAELSMSDGQHGGVSSWLTTGVRWGTSSLEYTSERMRFLGLLEVVRSPWNERGVVVVAQGFGHGGTIAALLLLAALLERPEVAPAHLAIPSALFRVLSAGPDEVGAVRAPRETNDFSPVLPVPGDIYQALEFVPPSPRS